MKFFRFCVVSLWLLCPVYTIAAIAPVNGIRIFYQIQGSGTPLLLLHGGYSDHHAFDGVISALSHKYRVIVIDSRGHGASTDDAKAYTYSLLTADTIAVLDYLQLETVDVVGWSDGAVIALQLQINHPERISKAVLIGATIQFDHSLQWFPQQLISVKPLFQLYANLMLKGNYYRDNPYPKHWPVFRDRVFAMWHERCYLTVNTLESCAQPLTGIHTPTLIMVGANEMVLPQQTQLIHQSIKNSRLRVIPDADHFVLMQQPEAVGAAILNFLKTS